MKPLKQRYRHDPDNGVYGDCHRTAIATILELERDDVPHFAHDFPTAEEFHRRAEEFLNSRGWRSVTIPYCAEPRDVMNAIGGVNGDDCVYLLSGVSPRGTKHTVVCRGSDFFSDPALDGGDLVGPCKDGYTFATFIVPISYRT